MDQEERLMMGRDPYPGAEAANKRSLVVDIETREWLQSPYASYACLLLLARLLTALANVGASVSQTNTTQSWVLGQTPSCPNYS